MAHGCIFNRLQTRAEASVLGKTHDTVHGYVGVFVGFILGQVKRSTRSIADGTVVQKRLCKVKMVCPVSNWTHLYTHATATTSDQCAHQVHCF